HTIFMLLPRPPPCSTLFPYTTLFRSPMFENFLLVPQELVQVRRPEVADPAPEGEVMRWSDHGDRIPLNEAEVADHRDDGFHRRRSEEHTSELQSPCNLVCRLLLEKKK